VAGCNSVRCPDSECMVFIGPQEPLGADRNGAKGLVAATDQITRKGDPATPCSYTFVASSSAPDCFVEPNRTVIRLA
jgi:hypothetical protein